ncbi:hypothetical protein E2C01_007964 [Portunus trituberculatus]|uniref:Uncharacterized protein n=1 Tax=Portunus trituberculatus TaxID=210409 RepID=A0A5B7D0C9_PORTR|nr:hypothetical protein [Portunus trituberculatus]
MWYVTCGTYSEWKAAGMEEAVKVPAGRGSPISRQGRALNAHPKATRGGGSFNTTTREFDRTTRARIPHRAAALSRHSRAAIEATLIYGPGGSFPGLNSPACAVQDASQNPQDHDGAFPTPPPTGDKSEPISPSKEFCWLQIRVECYPGALLMPSHSTFTHMAAAADRGGRVGVVDLCYQLTRA